jgi:fermentation-respiration switch protein FrsA (DUF1100 family)
MQNSAELQVADYTLRGMLHRPSGSGKYPGVIMYHGFTGTKLEPHRIFWKTSRALEAAGIASVRFDFSGHGESDGHFEEMTLTREVEEGHAILKYTQGLNFIDNERIGILGLSLGGAVASVVAGDVGKQVASLCLWAPAGMIREIFNVIHGGVEPDEAGYIDLGGNRLGAPARDDLNGWDVYGRAQCYKGPVQIIHGDADITVPIKASEEYLRIYGEQANLLAVHEADHTFNRHDWEDLIIHRTVKFFNANL